MRFASLHAPPTPCTKPPKYNLNKGTILDKTQQPLLLKSVAQAEIFLANNPYPKSYPPASGIPSFLSVAKEIAKIDNFAAVATPSCGAFQVALEVLKGINIDRILTRSPTWFMYSQFVGEAGVQLDSRNETFAEIANSLQQGECLLIQAGCYNPDGNDLTIDEIQKVSDIVKEKNGVILLDLAYQGIKVDIREDDDFTKFYQNNVVITQFFDKNFGIYGEGASVVYCSDQKVQKSLEAMVERKFGIVPIHGQYIVQTVWGHFKDVYIKEMAEVRDMVKMKKMILQTEFDNSNMGMNILKQNGIYAFLNLNEQQMGRCLEQGLELGPLGRINICGITEQNVSEICRMIKLACE